jgi:hypothetical protein
MTLRQPKIQVYPSPELSILGVEWLSYLTRGFMIGALQGDQVSEGGMGREAKRNT